MELASQNNRTTIMISGFLQTRAQIQDLKRLHVLPSNDGSRSDGKSAAEKTEVRIPSGSGDEREEKEDVRQDDQQTVCSQRNEKPQWSSGIPINVGSRLEIFNRSISAWYIGTVCELGRIEDGYDGDIKVHYDAYGTKYDEWHNSLRSEYIAPLNTHIEEGKTTTADEETRQQFEAKNMAKRAEWKQRQARGEKSRSAVADWCKSQRQREATTRTRAMERRQRQRQEGSPTMRYKHSFIGEVYES